MWTVIERLSKEEFGESLPIGPLLRLAVDGNKIFNICADYDEATFNPGDLDELILAGESYVLNMNLVGDRMGFDDKEEMEDEFEDDFDDEFEDDFDEF